jgi:hypothetical protein
MMLSGRHPANMARTNTTLSSLGLKAVPSTASNHPRTNVGVHVLHSSLHLLEKSTPHSPLT